MLKTVGMFRLPKGKDGDEFWDEHVGTHAARIVEEAGDLLRGYTVSRVRLPLVGEPAFWGMVELWFDDEQDRAEFDRRTDAIEMGPGPHFEDYVAEFSAVEVEERVVVPAPHSE